MAIHDDGTMDVRVDGRTERRPYSISRIPFSDGRAIPAQYEPELREGEEVLHFLDGPPVIVRVHD